MTEPYQYRNADGSLRLDEALGERYVAHYVRMLRSSDQEFAALQLTAAVATAPPDEDAAWYAWAEPPRGKPVDGYVLQPRGHGPDTCSSSVAVALQPEIIWDVCGYYRRLGFHWTEFRQVSRKVIRHRWLALDPAQGDGELAYAAQQLLDPVIRRAYDLQPLGGLFMGDRGVREMFERRAAQEATRRNAEAHEQGLYEDDGDVSYKEDVLREWGFEPGTSANEARERLRGTESDPLPGEGLGATLGGWERNWSYYHLADPRDPDWASLRADAMVLEAWQALLCAVLSEHGVTVQFSVGIWPGPGPRMWRDSKERCIIFFTEGTQVSRGTAAEAVRGYLAHRETAEETTDANLD